MCAVIIINAFINTVGILRSIVVRMYIIVPRELLARVFDTSNL